MPKFKITFKHLIEETHEAVVEAKNQEEAVEFFKENPFEFLDRKSRATQGLGIKIIETEKIDEI